MSEENAVDTKEEAKKFLVKVKEHLLKNWIVYSVGVGAFILGIIVG